jgi:putative ABC transport system permease protein
MTELRAQLRQMGHRPAHTAAIVVSLAVGMTVCVSVFAVIDALIFAEVPGISERRTLVRLAWTAHRGQFTGDEYDVLARHEGGAFATFAAQHDRDVAVVAPAGATRVTAAFVSARFFETLGASPVRGRLLHAGDALGSAAPAVVVSESWWRGALNGQPNVIGRVLAIDGRSFTVVGVAPARAPGLRPLDGGARESDYPQLWLPLRVAASSPRLQIARTPALVVAARLQAGRSLAAGRAEVSLLRSRLPNQPFRRDTFLRVYRSGLDWRDVPGESLLTLGLFLAVPLGVLAIGCVNVINLQLARAVEQAGELSLRLALGASRLRLVRMLSVEVAVLSAIAMALAWSGSWFATTRMQELLATPIGVDLEALVFAAVLMTAVTMAAGLAPAWFSTRTTPAAGLRPLQAGISGRTRGRALLVAVQVGASLALLALSSLAIRTIIVRQPQMPADAARILLADVDLTELQGIGSRPGPFVETVLDELRHEGAIETAAFSTFSLFGSPIAWARADSPDTRVAFGGFVTTEWFDAIGVRLLAGRTPISAEPAGEVVINAAMARAVGASTASVIGAPLRIRNAAAPAIFQTVHVVGVMADTVKSPDGAPTPMIVLPMPSAAASRLVLTARVRDVPSAAKAFVRAAAAADKAVPLGRIESLDERVRAVFSGFRELAVLGVSLGLLALVLAALGLYSLMAYTVRRRTREIGVRLAIGATPRDILLLVLGRGARLVLGGTLGGVVVAAIMASVLRAVLTAVSPFDPWALLPSVGALVLAAMIACALPAYRAARVDPVRALRDE